MGFTCGLVGLPNVGKSTIFNALTRAGGELGNYAFSTVKPVTGVVAVPDERLNRIGELIPAKKTVHTTLEFIDIAGLVEGSSRGEGLGNKFLGHIRQVDALAHVVRCFEDPNISHISNTIDPPSDIEVIHTELMIADLETLDRRRLKLEKIAKSGDSVARFEMGLVEKISEILNAGKPARTLQTHSEDEAGFIKSLDLLTSKPVLYVCNIVDPADSKGELVRAALDYAGEEGNPAVVLAGKLENEIMEIEDLEEQKAFMEEMRQGMGPGYAPGRGVIFDQLRSALGTRTSGGEFHGGEVFFFTNDPTLASDYAEAPTGPQFASSQSIRAAKRPARATCRGRSRAP